MNEISISSRKLSERMGISQRHARRLIKARDWRVEGPDREYLLRRSRERIAQESRRRAHAIEEVASALRRAPETEVFREGQEIDALKAIAAKLSTAAADLRALAGVVYPS